jgi:hypothetical protein
MRQTISGLVAAIAVVTVSAVPALACGGGGLFQSSCSPCGQAFVSPCAQVEAYVPPAPVYSGCDSCGGGWAHERLSDPVQQYYYVNQGPTYTGPGDFAPYPTYQESAVSGWGAYRHHSYHYGYDGGRYADAMTHQYDGAPNVEGPAIYGYRAHPRFRPWHAHMGYHYSERPSVRYGYAPHRYGYEAHHSYAPHYSLPPREAYPQHHSLRYGYGAPVGAPRHYGYREHVLRRYN